MMSGDVEQDWQVAYDEQRLAGVDEEQAMQHADDVISDKYGLRGMFELCSLID